MPTGTVSATVPIAQAAPMGVETPCMEVREAGAESVHSVEPAAKATVPSLQLHLTVIGQKGQFFAFTLPENQPKVIGRDDRADVVLLINGEADTKLSGKHCTMQWTDGRVFVCDNNSTNGTFVNGSQVIPGSLQQLEEGCILRIGSREYRVSMGPQA